VAWAGTISELQAWQMSIQFEWDEEKASGNENKHGVTFEEARTIFNDPFAITIADPAHSAHEDRWLDIGFSSQGRLLVVWYVERGGSIRNHRLSQGNKNRREGLHR
jgi:uncharacterized DUF497 family protein